MSDLKIAAELNHSSTDGRSVVECWWYSLSLILARLIRITASWNKADQSSLICRILSKLHWKLVEPICRCQLEVHLAGTSITRTRLTSNKWNYTIQLFERVIRSAMAELGWNSKFFRNSTRISFLGAIRNCCRYQIVSVVALHYERVEEGSILRHLHLLLEP